MTIINVTAGQSLQTAIDQAQLGDTINVEAGATFRGPIWLTAKSGEGQIMIQSSRVGELPQGRVGPQHAPLMPKIIALDARQVDNNQAIHTKPGAHDYNLVGIEILPDPGAEFLYDLVRFGEGAREQSTLASVPHHLKMDRCYVHGLPTSDFQSGLQLNSSDTEITRCYFSEIHGRGKDSQAIVSWNTPGRNKIIDCYLEAAGENVMFGGVDPASAEMIPSDCQILRCHLFKPLTWKGQGWVIKNLLEFKIGKRIVIDGCVLENNWGGEGQSGVAILFTVRNQDCAAPWSTVQQCTYTNNTLINAEGGAFNFLGKDNEAEPAYGKCKDPATMGSIRGSDVLISNNLFHGMRGAFITLNGFYNVTVDRNTHFQKANLTTIYGESSQGFRYTNNLTQDHDYGIYTEGGTGAAGRDKMIPGGVIEGNIIAAPYDRAGYPVGNDYPETLPALVDFRSPFTGKGCDIDKLMAAQAGATQPAPIPVPTPEPVPTPTPEPVPVPVPEPVPTPVPEPQPTPIPPPPTPVPTISAPQSITVRQYGSGQINVNLSNLTGPTTVTVAGSSGQVQVSPLSKTVSGTSAIVSFNVRVKHQSRTITFQTLFGSVSVRVNVT